MTVGNSGCWKIPQQLKKKMFSLDQKKGGGGHFIAVPVFLYFGPKEKAEDVSNPQYLFQAYAGYEKLVLHLPRRGV